MIDKQLTETANWQIAHNWHAGLSLTYAGVNLGDVLTYDTLNVLGRIWKMQTGATETVADIPAETNGSADGKTHTAS